jgi:DNA-binding NtrC family response regulator
MEALEAALAHAGQIALWLTDVVMAKMPGKALAERLAVIRPALRVLYMSGYAQPSLVPTGGLEPGVVLIGGTGNKEL